MVERSFTAGADEEPLESSVRLAHGRIAYSVAGDQGPTVVLETGLGAESAEWASIQRALAPDCRVFRYDRPGRGRSDPPTVVRDVVSLAETLHALLRQTCTPPPYLLVGHSFGGLIARIFAQTYPDQVCGLILVESMHVRQFDVFAGEFPPPGDTDTPERARMRAFWQGGWRDPNATPERLDIPASFRACASMVGLGNLPVTVITAGSFANSQFFPAATRDVLQARWDNLQREYLQLSTHALLTRAPASQHFVHRDSPSTVIQSIRAMLRDTR